MVSNLSIVFMVLSLIFSIAVPVIGAIYGKKKLGCSLRLFLLGCIFFFISVIVVEAFFHNIILSSVPAISQNIFLYAIYGGLMAGIFEETARLLAYKYFCRGRMNNDKDAIMYGIGHGGFEAFFLLFSGMISNIIMSSMINSGTTNLLLESLPAESASAINTTIDALISTKSYMFLLGMYERIPAICLHISLSVIVWFAVKNNKTIYYILAIFFHFIMDAVTAILASYINEILVEVMISVMAILIAYISIRIYKSEHIDNNTSVLN